MLIIAKNQDTLWCITAEETAALNHKTPFHTHPSLLNYCHQNLPLQSLNLFHLGPLAKQEQW